jgi:hypothetical protein
MEKTINATNADISIEQSPTPIAEKIQDIVQTILKSKMTTHQKRSFFSVRYPVFKTQHPYLFNMATNRDLPPKELKYLHLMLESFGKLCDKNLKESELIDVHKSVYGPLRENYIDPKMNMDEETKKKLDEFMNKKEYTKEELESGPKINFDTR